MGWEWRQGHGPYYIRKHKSHGHVVRHYFGRGALAKLAAGEDAHQRTVKAAHHALCRHLEILDVHVQDWSQHIKSLTRASLLVAGYHQHHRGEWRKRAGCPSPPHALALGASTYKESAMATMTTPQDLTTSLQTLVQRGMAGDRAVLPALRELLTTRPELWRHLRTLGTQVEHVWIQVLAGNDLVAQEVLAQQLQMLKHALGGPSPTALEQLLIERIGICWLQTYQADLWAAHHGTQHHTWIEHRQERTQARFLAAVKALAQIRKLLRPGATVQVNIAQQQVNVG
jgi:hypothetical protein